MLVIPAETRSVMTVCAACNTENPEGHKFCFSCGSALQLICPACESPNDPGNRFCFNCGTGLEADHTQVDATSTAQAPVPATPGRTERRFVSVLFADLVGFTTFSENRDSEDVRAMLTIYFDRCREIIERYGGQVDKFIGDAVMGVWGAVAAHEDDAERATRAAMDLVAMVPQLGEEIGVADLQARAGVLSGETAVGPGGNENGLVVGDLVNTASRLQSIAPPGGVFIGGSTRDLVAGRIEVVEAGEHDVKGKEESVAAFQPTRVIADQSRRADTDLIEGPFVGRDDELRVLKDQLHATGREGKTRLVSIVGDGGIGKTRLTQELLKYIDGIAESVYYHHGRSPSYGDGVTFWALGEMVRQRARIAETDDPTKARLRLRTMVAEYVADETDQRWIEPRLAGLIGLGEMPQGDRSELFSALRSFFQKIAERGTVLMVFEDLQWADDGLIEFIDELAERSTQHPILIVTLARPELLDRHSDWGIGRKRTLSMHLSALERDAMRELVAGLAPGLPETMVNRIADRTAGVPLHAVEFIRMLVNSEQLVRHGDVYVFEEGDGELALPDSLNAIIGARLDRLDEYEQELIQDASVLGYVFSLTALAPLRGETVEALEPTMRDLVRRELLEFNEDPRSPERGQYRFVQGLIMEVAYARLTRSEKVTRHLAVASALETSPDVELAGVIASHYAKAASADPSNVELGVKARSAVTSAAERAASLHSHEQAARLYEQAIALTDDGAQIASLKVLASRSAHAAGQDNAERYALDAFEWSTAAGDDEGVAVAVTEIANQLAGDFRVEEAIDMILPIFEHSDPQSTRAWAALASATSRSLMLGNRSDEAVRAADKALVVIEELGDVALGIDTLITKGTALASKHHQLEGAAQLRGAAELARIHDLTGERIRALNNLGAISQVDDRGALLSEEELETVERFGNRTWIIRLRFFMALGLDGHGRYDDALAHLDSEDRDDLSEFWIDWYELVRLSILLTRDGFDPDRFAKRTALLTNFESTSDSTLLSSVLALQTQATFDTSDFERALERAISREVNSLDPWPEELETGLAAAGWLGRSDAVATLSGRIAEWRGGRAIRGLSLFADAIGFAIDGAHDEAISPYREAVTLWEDVGAPQSLAIMQAVFAKAAGPDTVLGREAGAAAYEWFSSVGATLYLDLLQEVFPSDATETVEAAG
ncbi:MAG: adenylate/guanylate cyclase domain-containing protein [Acidimicrobiia bacterium]|nr:MAG: adenylate/guanylate cyclase domain-containing protein [Acidimicrobiia bacterium]